MPKTFDEIIKTVKLAGYAEYEFDEAPDEEDLAAIDELRSAWDARETARKLVASPLSTAAEKHVLRFVLGE